MIQFNLLPDIKLKYIKTKRSRRNVIFGCIIVSGITFALFILMLLTANVFQKIHMNNLKDDIERYTNQLKEVKDLDKVLTVQNQLNSLTPLHDQKPITSRLFTYVSQLTPVQVSISKFEVDLTTNTINVTGSSDSLASVNKFIDTLKFTTYKTADGTENKAFSDVVLSSFTRTEKGATYTITFKYDPKIFAGDQEVTLIVPSTTTTRSTTEKPSELFQPTGSGQ